MKCINVYVYRMYIGPITKTHIGLPILNQYTFACWEAKNNFVIDLSN